MEGENNIIRKVEHPQEKPEEEGELIPTKEELQAESLKKLKVFCPWCGKVLGEKDGKGVEGVSAGLCTKCHAKLEAQITLNK